MTGKTQLLCCGAHSLAKDAAGKHSGMPTRTTGPCYRLSLDSAVRQQTADWEFGQEILLSSPLLAELS